MASVPSPSEILERLHLKLAMSESDQQLQTFTNNHLLDIINIAGNHMNLVPKIQEMLSHYNRRVRSNSVILLPAIALLQTYLTASPVASTLCLMYLRLSRERISPETHLQMLPVYLEAVSKRSADVNQCYELLSLAMPGFVALSNIDKSQWPEISISPSIQPHVLRFFHTIIVFECPNKKDQLDAAVQQLSGAEAVSSQPGLSTNEFLVVAKKVVVENTSTNNLKLAVVKLLTAGLFDEHSSFPLLVLSGALSNNALDDAASSALKKVDITKCVDDKAVVEQLMTSYLGSAALKTKPPAKDMVYQGSMLMKLKIIPFLTRSEIAATTYMNNIKICLDVLGPSTASYPKLQAAGLQFVLKVIERMPASALGSLGPSLFQRLRKTEEGDLDSASMSLVLRCMGALGKAQPSLVVSNLEILTHLFSTIALYDENTAYAVVDCLVAWLPAFCRSSDSVTASKLKELVATYVTHENAKSRLVALKYVEALLSSSEMDVKWLLLNASGDSRDEMRNESSRLLEMSLRSAVPPIQFASEFIASKLSRDIRKCIDFTERQLPIDAESLAVVPEVHQMCSRYLWAVCESASGGTPELRIVEGDEHWRVTAPKIAQFVKTMDREVAHRLAAVALLAIKDSHDVHLFRIAACFVLASSFDISQSLLTAAATTRSRNSTRVELSSCSSMLAACLTSSQNRADAFKQAFDELKTSPLGGLCWLASSFASAVDGPPSDTIPLARQLLTRLMELAEEGYQRPGSLLEAALGALATLARNFYGEKDLSLTDEEFSGIIAVCEKIAASRKDSLSMRAREAAIEVIGLLVTKDNNEERRKQVISSLFAIGEGPPQPELQLTTGAALWDACLGTNTAARRNPYLESESDRKVSTLDAAARMSSEKLLTETMTVVMDEKLLSGNHHLRRAALVWLLILVQKCGTAGVSCLDSMLDSIQGAFADGLTENDDFTQDIASKGMGVVYQMAGAEQRKSLVAGLMTGLAEGRRSTTKVQGDTVLFKEGQLGKSPDGSNLTTYKELCSLATDLNQPDLVYKFMQLAKHNATWNAKKGAAFGFGAVLEQAREELDPYIGQLVPKLFRYRYDPDAKVQQSMRSIWTVLTQTRRNVVDEFADEIFRELTPQLTHKEWRVRESSCLALSDLLRGHDTPLMHGQVPEILSIILRVKDDVKESVRLAAERTAESIRKLIVKLSSSTNRERADAFLSALLPVLIEKGVNSSIKANKGFSLSLLIELAKTAGPQLRPYLSELIPVLLDAISDCESAVLNYLAVRSSNTQLEALDDARAQMARTSPMMTAIYDILPQIDGSVLVAMQPKVCDQLRASVGVSTRAAASQLITQLALRAPQLMMDHQTVCDKFFTALIPGVRDRNPSIRKNFANAMSYLAKFASSNQMTGLVKQIAKDLISENDDMKQATKHVLRNLLAHCPEIVKGYASDIVPYVFLETCQEVIKGDDSSKKRHDEWSELWGDLVPSTDAAVRLYRSEIISVAVDTLQNNAVWVVRAQAGRMLARTAEALGDGMEADEAVSLISTLLPLLSGRVWKGKENILSALAAVINSTGDTLRDKWTEEQMQEVLTIVQREASKRNKEYSAAGIWTCAVFASSLACTAAADWLLAKVDSNVQKALDPKNDGSSDDESLTNLEKEALLAKMVAQNLVAMAKAMGAYRQGAEAEAAVRQLCSYFENQNLYWKARQDMVVTLLDTVEKWQLDSVLPSTRLVESLLLMAEEMCEHQRKTIASQCLLVVMKMAERRVVFSVDWDSVGQRLRDSRAVSETGLSARLETAMEVD